MEFPNWLTTGCDQRNSGRWQTVRLRDFCCATLSQQKSRLCHRFTLPNSRFYRTIACNATHGIAKPFLSVLDVLSYILNLINWIIKHWLIDCLALCLSNACIATKHERKKLALTFLYHKNGHSSSGFLTRSVHCNAGPCWGTPMCLKF